MYNSHRPPIGVPAAAPNARLGELLDQIRSEFEGQNSRSVEYEQQRESLSRYAPSRRCYAQRHRAAEDGSRLGQQQSYYYCLICHIPLRTPMSIALWTPLYGLMLTVTV